MKFSYLKITSLFIVILFLTGCMYPASERAENQIPQADQLAAVQSGIEQYQEENNGVLPIRTKSSDTPIFEKYLIDFTKMQDANTLSQVPGNSFEGGGHYQYVLIDVETNPTVKLLDLRTTEAIRSVNIRLEVFRQENTYPAFGEQVEDDIYLPNYEELNLDEQPTVISPFSQAELPIIMDVYGTLYIDYRPDLQIALEEFEHEYEEGDDIRFLLTEHYPFVPAYSLPYTVKDGKPIFMENHS